MSAELQNILTAVASLSPTEQEFVVRELLRRNTTAAPTATSADEPNGVVPPASEVAAKPNGKRRKKKDRLLPYEEWIVEFHKWTRSPKKGNPNVDVSRESIYD